MSARLPRFGGGVNADEESAGLVGVLSDRVRILVTFVSDDLP